MKRTLLALLTTASLLTGCGILSARSEAPAPAFDLASPPLGGAPAEQELFPAAPLPTAGYSDESANAAGGGGNVEPSSVERLVIQNANLSVVVSDVESRMKQISDMARNMGGFVVSSNLYQSYTNNYIEVPEGTITIRVPAARLDEALILIKTDVVEVQNETRSGEDVTAQYVDLQSRLKNLEAAEAKLDEIMQQATETEDVVNVFNQLVYYREQIELVKGQMKYYEEAASLSAVTIQLIAEEKTQPVKVGPWEPKGVALEAIQDLVNFSKDFVEFLIRFALYTLPVWIMIGTPLYLVFLGIRAIYRKWRAGRVKEAPPSMPAVEDKKKKK